MKDVVTIESEEFYYKCGDGCCTEWGDDVTVSLNGQLVKEFRVAEFYPDATAMILEALGFEVVIKYTE